MKVEINLGVLAKFITGIIGSHCEVVVHDLDDASKSVVAIENGHITGRGINSPATDFALKKIKTIEEEKSLSYNLNYRGVSSSGVVLRSSTMVVKQNGNTRYLLCVNIDENNFNKAINLIKELMPSVDDAIESDETFHSSIEDLSNSIVEAAMKKLEIFDLSKLITEEKTLFVREVDKSGLFTIKGHVQKIAKQLNISEQTLYRYLKE